MSQLVSMRKAYGDALVALGRTNDRIVALSADVQSSDYSSLFEAEFPSRFINVGIAEQCLVDTAVGFALSGRIPFANTFAFLFATRALEMVRTHCCLGKANVKLMAAYAGLSDSFDGPTHHSITDIAIMRSLPNMTVVVPADSVAVAKLLPQIADWNGPVYCRLNRNEVPVIYDEAFQPTIGKAHVVRQGTDATILACGLMVARSIDAAEELAADGIAVRVVDVHTIKPLDEETVLSCARETGALVTVEEHSVIGGLGGAVAECLCENAPVPLKRVGIADTFAQTGPYATLLEAYGMDVRHITNAVRTVLQTTHESSPRSST